MPESDNFFTPNGAASIEVSMGINYTFPGYIIQNFNEGHNVQNLEIADQKGRTCQVIAYDTGKSLSFTMIGPDTDPFTSAKAITIGSDGAISVTSSASTGDYVVQSCERACTYNDTAKWNVQAIGWEHAAIKDYTNSAIP